MKFNLMKSLSYPLFLLLVLNLDAETDDISFEYYQRLIFLNVSINNSDSLLFLLDTGANTSAIDAKTAERLKLKIEKHVQVEGTAGIITVPSVMVESVTACNKTVSNLSLTSYDLSSSLAPSGKKLDGILGTDFLKKFAMTLDFVKNKISLSGKVKDPLNAVYTFEMDNGIPRIQAKINNKSLAWFRYDSRSSLFDSKNIYLNSTSFILAELKELDPNIKPSVIFSATGVGGSIELPVYKISNVLFDKLEIKEPYLIIQPNQGYFARSDAVGFFGNNLLEKFQKVCIDFSDCKMYVYKSQIE